MILLPEPHDVDIAEALADLHKQGVKYMKKIGALKQMLSMKHTWDDSSDVKDLRETLAAIFPDMKDHIINKEKETDKNFN